MAAISFGSMQPYYFWCRVLMSLSQFHQCLSITLLAILGMACTPNNQPSEDVEIVVSEETGDIMQSKDDEIVVLDGTGNIIQYHNGLGYAIEFYDHRQATQNFMDANHLQGGGYTFGGLIVAALRLEAPLMEDLIELDLSGDYALVTTQRQDVIQIVQQLFQRLMVVPEFRDRCIEKARESGDLE